MSTAPDPTTPAAITPQPPAPRPWSLGERAAWAVILIVVALVACLAAQSQLNQAAAAEPDIMLPIMARYDLGVHLLYSQMGGAKPTTEIDNRLLAQLDRAATAPPDRFRAAILAGELQGPAAALDRLQLLATQTPVLAADIRTASSVYTTGQLPENWPAFQARYRWFADLLASNAKPPADPLRAATLARAWLTLGILFAVVVGASLMAIAGLVLFIIALIRLARGKLKLAFSPLESPNQPADRRAYAFASAVYLGGYVALSLGPRFLFPNAPFSLGTVALVIPFLLGIALPLFLGQSRQQWQTALGLHTGRGIFREIAGGLLAYLAGMPLMALGLLLVLILSKFTGIKGTHPIVHELQGGPWELALVFFLACVFAPITEELMFRGALFAHLRERFPWWLAAPTTAILFALMHPQSWIALPALAALALTFAAIREWRGSILGSMAAHALHNGLTLIVAVILLR